MSTEQLMDQMCMTLGGRASEMIFFDRITTGKFFIFLLKGLFFMASHLTYADSAHF